MHKNNFCLYYLPLVHTTYEDGAECSETSAHKIQTSRNDPKEIIQLYLYFYRIILMVLFKQATD